MRTRNRGLAIAKQTGHQPAESGVSLILALLMVLLLSSVAAAMIFVTQTELWSTANYRQMVQARYVAEAGAEQTALWLNTNAGTIAPPTGDINTTTYPVTCSTGCTVTGTGANAAIVLSANSGVASNYPVAATQTSFNSYIGGLNTVTLQAPVTGSVSATFATYATLLATQSGLMTWQITSVGTIPGVRNSTVQVQETLAQSTTSIFNYAVAATGTGCGQVDITGNSNTDSFTSANGGTYATTHSTTGGNIGTNGNVSATGNTTIDGSILANGGTCSSPATLNGNTTMTGTVVASPPVTYPPATIPSPTPPTTTPTTCATGYCNGNGTQALGPGQYGNIELIGNYILQLSAGTYNINSITMTGNVQIQVTSGPVVINVMGTGVAMPIDITGNGIANNTGIASNLIINYNGTGNVTLTGNSASYAVVYAPNAPVTVTGNANWYGAIVGYKVNLTGNMDISYDRALASLGGSAGGFHRVGFTWNKF